MTNPAEAYERDAADRLAHFAAEFHHPRDPDGRRSIYLCGHSLGLQAKTVSAYVEQELADWRRLGVLGHTAARNPWIGYHEAVSEPLAELVGASAAEVVAMNSLTVNLHLMMVSFFRPDAARNCILIEKSSFPSDRYAIVSQLRLHGLDAESHLIEIEPRQGEQCLRTEDLVAGIEQYGERLALVLLPGVQYLTGQALDLAPVIASARRCGANVGLDLAHAIGNILLELHDWNADFAVWCSYKYLNAGPGAIGGCFVHERHATRSDLPRLAGWWGHDKDTRFLMGPEFKALPGAEGWQISNPPILSAAPLIASLDIFRRAGLRELRAKSMALTAFLERSIEFHLPGRAEIITPPQPEARGCQLSIRLKGTPAEARRRFATLTEAGVIGDWREPDILRLAPTPLYNSFADALHAIEALARAARP
ncbi:MAG TPA: kynureninase [Steroidobacteraceae bacterium]|nr:kynureninase [Steroidobacteraceae bacterium]